ncbi:hypothetical protein JTE90_015384 [Oedothorax gibbosus]|uniref:Aminoacyl-tRNA synthetase class II (G/ P/ S/T) domain-containing protein n=1 Tax=Oedothorax gibbosus TaxID=931172 RepID=A0AAV6U511_9ARAC|nr:hypothetical protein JTE90_015384 [Oedothorax gibbosus]
MVLCFLRNRFLSAKRLNLHVFVRNAHQLNLNKVDNSSELTKKPLSTLYVPGRRGKDVYQIVRPLIDVDFISKNIDGLKRSCRLRGLSTQLNLDELVPKLLIWDHLRTEYKCLVEKDKEFLEKFKELSSSGTENLELSKEHYEFIQILKSTKTKLHDIEDEILPDVQLIPNFVDDLTPHEKDVILLSEPVDQELSTVSHKVVGTNMGLLTFSETSPTAYYLLGELSELEHAINTYFAMRLMPFGFAPMACPDFCKSFISEAVGSDPHSQDNCIQLQPPKDNNKESGQKNIVVGSSSFETFCAYFTNMNVNESNLPLRYFSQGRSYDARHRNVQSPDLFTVVQSTSIHSLVVCKDSDAEREFENLFDHITSCYSDFKISRRIVEVSAANLNPTETRRKRLELWSPSQKKFIPVAHTSQRGDFISKRLHATYGVDYHAKGYCTFVEGSAVQIPVLIGCILENYQTSKHTFDFQKTLEFLHEYI